MNLPTRLTVGRLVLCIAFTFFLEVNLHYSGVFALVIFILASVTDWLDGYYARKLKQITDLGKLLDPLADKILISAAFIAFSAKGLAPAWIVVCIIAREFMITGLRSLAASKGIILAAQTIGKHKTVSQIITALVALLILTLKDFSVDPRLLFDIQCYVLDPLLYITLAITLYSGVAYFVSNQTLVFDSMEGKK
jgi:CDP-diacylglycerol--glycerol-3-phosphate 3-phosphatidyltransferase